LRGYRANETADESLLEDFYFAILNDYPAFGEKLYSLWISDTFLLENPGGESIRAVCFFDLAGFLLSIRKTNKQFNTWFES
jgi:hypothetical protein